MHGETLEYFTRFIIRHLCSQVAPNATNSYIGHLQFTIDALRPLYVISTLCPISLNCHLAYYTENKTASRDYDKPLSLDEGHGTKCKLQQ